MSGPTPLNILSKKPPEDLKITKGREFSRASFPEGEILFKEKSFRGINYIEAHPQIQPKHQGKGIAGEKIKALVQVLNKPAYFSHGRILNENVYRVLEKIKADHRFTVTEDERGIWVKPIPHETEQTTH
jgi:hypothetical protein